MQPADLLQTSLFAADPRRTAYHESSSVSVRHE